MAVLRAAQIPSLRTAHSGPQNSAAPKGRSALAQQEDSSWPSEAVLYSRC